MSHWKNKLIKLQKKLEKNIIKTDDDITRASKFFQLRKLEELRAKKYYLKLFKEDVDKLLQEDENG